MATSKSGNIKHNQTEVLKGWGGVELFTSDKRIGLVESLGHETEDLSLYGSPYLQFNLKIH